MASTEENTPKVRGIFSGLHTTSRSLIFRPTPIIHDETRFNERIIPLKLSFDGGSKNEDSNEKSLPKPTFNVPQSLVSS